MSAADFEQSIHDLSALGWQWSDTKGQVSAHQLHRAPPLGHLYDYVLASNFLVPLQIPVDLTTDA
jgi:hypothetical protein